MDAFLQRQLFKQDVVLLLTQPTAGADGVTNVISLIESHGGLVVAEQDEKHGDRVNILLLPGSQQDQQDDEMLRRVISRFPKAEVLRSQWVLDSVEKNRRLTTTTYRVLQDQTPKTQDQGQVSSRTQDLPPAKRQKVVTPTSAAFFAAKTSSNAQEEPQLTPNFTPWRKVQHSLFVLDARAKQQQQDGETERFKVAGFDLDGTLIVTKSGKRFAKDKDDWKWFHASLVREKLAQLARDGFTLVIFSNQNGIAKGHITAAQVQSKLEQIVKQLNLPMLVLLGTENDAMRKPRLGAWNEMTKLLGAKGEEAIEKGASFYCGDAAGRPKIAGRPKDFAATDYKFALNAGVRFFTPEDLFLGTKQRIHTRPDTWELGFDPKSIALSESAAPLLNPPSARTVNSDQEIVVLVGPPASGKSFFAKTHLISYVCVSQDELRTVANCKKKCLEAIAQKKSVVIDNTNRDPRARKEWLAIAQDKNLPIRCFEMDVPKPLAMHLNTFRSLTEQKKIPDVAIHGFYKNLVSPTVKEGFAEVVKVPFRVDRNVSEADQALLRSYL